MSWIYCYNLQCNWFVRLMFVVFINKYILINKIKWSCMNEIIFSWIERETKSYFKITESCLQKKKNEQVGLLTVSIYFLCIKHLWSELFSIKHKFWSKIKLYFLLNECSLFSNIDLHFMNQHFIGIFLFYSHRKCKTFSEITTSS